MWHWCETQKSLWLGSPGTSDFVVARLDIGYHRLEEVEEEDGLEEAEEDEDEDELEKVEEDEDEDELEKVEEDEALEGGCGYPFFDRSLAGVGAVGSSVSTTVPSIT